MGISAHLAPVIGRVGDATDGNHGGPVSNCSHEAHFSFGTKAAGARLPSPSRPPRPNVSMALGMCSATAVATDAVDPTTDSPGRACPESAGKGESRAGFC